MKGTFLSFHKLMDNNSINISGFYFLRLILGIIDRVYAFRSHILQYSKTPFASLS